MTLLDELKNNYEVNTPIFIEDLQNYGYSYETIRKMLSNYAKQGEIKRYIHGVYYFPIVTELGDSILPLEIYITKKYINRNEESIGYYAGLSLLNRYGLSTQVPNIREITTNEEKTKKRTVKINNREFILRRPLVKITNENRLYLEVLDIFRYASEYVIDENLDLLKRIILDNKLKIDILNELLTFYPKKVKILLKEKGLYNEFA